MSRNKPLALISEVKISRILDNVVCRLANANQGRELSNIRKRSRNEIIFSLFSIQSRFGGNCGVNACKKLNFVGLN